MLVALFIFSVISVGSLGSLQSAIQAKEATAEAAARHEDISLLRASLRADLSQIILRDNRDPFGGRDEVLFRGGFNELLDFTRIGRVNPAGVFARSDIQRVRYIVEEGQLIRRALAHENPAPLTETSDRILISGLSSADIIFTRNRIDLPQIELPRGSTALNLDYATLILRFEKGGELTQIFEMEAF
jgi:general secretion pathway protein J